jgi:hypothetical protein
MPVNGKAMPGLETLAASTNWRPVIAKVVNGRGNQVPMVMLQLHDQLYRDSDGKIPPEIVTFCPRCGNNWQIMGDHRTITVEYLEKPVKIELPGGQFINQTAVVSMEGEGGCPWEDDSGGKGVCGYRFRLVDNVMYPTS